MNSHKGPIALLGTSADPPTCGHEALLKGLLTLFPHVATWASDNPKKQHKQSLKTRHDLLNSLVKAINNPRLELVQELSSPWSVDTLEKATRKWPRTKFIFVIGSDLAKEVPSWANAQSLLKKTSLGIAPREGWPMNQKDLDQLKSLGGTIYVLPLKIPSSSSSSIQAKPLITQIPSSILPILKNQKLYGLSNNCQ